MNNEKDVKQGQSEKLPLFDYKQVDKETAKYLRQKAKKLSKIDTLSLADAGKELKEVQELLAETKGSFQEWTESLGISPKTAYNYMNVYTFFMKHVSHVKLEKLPARILYQIAKPSAHPKLVEAVIAGTITSFKELKEYESSLVGHEEQANEKVDDIESVPENEQEPGEDPVDDKSYKEHLGLIYGDVARIKKLISQDKTIDEPEELLNIVEPLSKDILDLQELITKYIQEQEISRENRKGARFLFDIYTKK